MVNTKPVKLGKNIRQSFAHIDEVAEMPNLIEVQKNSYQWFLDEGLRAVFKDISSITDYQGNLQLDFIDFTLDDKPKYPLLECKERDVNFAAPLRVRARLINKVTGEIKESDIYMGDFPLMTEAGTFIINGAERVIVSQLVRSPGVYYGMHHDPAGKKLFDSTVIPNRGAWLEYDTDSADVFSVRIDKNRKLPVTTFIRSLLRLRDDVTVEQINADVNNALTGLRGTDEEIYEVFGRYVYLVKTAESKDAEMLGDEALLEVYRKLRPGEPPTIESAVKHLSQLLFDPRRYDLSRVGRYKYNKKLSLVPRITGKVLSRPVADPRTGEILLEAGALLSREDARLLESKGVDTVWITTAGLTPAGLQMAEDDGVEELKIFSNGMVDMADFTDYTPEELKAMGIRERVRFAVLSEILDMGLNREEMAEELTRRADELAQDALFLDNARVVFDVQRVRNRLRQRADVILTARLVVNAPRDQHIDQGDHINFPVRQKQLLHGKVDLLVLLQIEVLALHQRRNLVQRCRVNQHRAQKGLLRRHGEGEPFFNQFVRHRSLFRRHQKVQRSRDFRIQPDLQGVLPVCLDRILYHQLPLVQRDAVVRRQPLRNVLRRHRPVQPSVPAAGCLDGHRDLLQLLRQLLRVLLLGLQPVQPRALLRFRIVDRLRIRQLRQLPRNQKIFPVSVRDLNHFVLLSLSLYICQ